MCGICGIIHLNPGNTVCENALKRVNATLRHRGPDDEGVYRDGNVGLAMCRLSIIDVAGGHQPIPNEDKSKWIVFNGEIYNYLDLKRKLESTGNIFKTKTDTEVVLHLYEEEGEHCVDSLNGMFAFAIWDEKDRSLFLARDRLGIKPLYYRPTHHLQKGEEASARPPPQLEGWEFGGQAVLESEI